MKTFDVEECSDFLKVDRTTVLSLAGQGVLPGAKIGRSWVFLEDEIVEYLRAQVRQQTRLRQAETHVDNTLKIASERNPATLQHKPYLRRKPLPVLPELVSETAGS